MRYCDQMLLEEGRPFYRGNLHSHSTRSDGLLSPEALAAQYRDAGYNFLAMTDHAYFTDRSDLDAEDFLLLPGVEWDTPSFPAKGGWKAVHHVLGLGGDAQDGEPFFNDAFNGFTTSQELLRHMQRTLAKRNCLRVYNHPRWSQVAAEDLYEEIEGFHAVEVFNSLCDVSGRTGLADTLWDGLLMRGIRINAVASDDFHGLEARDGSRYLDAFGGWIQVQAESLTRCALLEAILKGRYYSSTGPEIHSLVMEDGELRVTCSPVRSIYCISHGVISSSGFEHVSDGGDTLTEFSFRPEPDTRHRYIRVECVDAHGRVAWSNPVYAEQ